MAVGITDGSPSPLPSPAIGEEIRVWVTWREDVWLEGLFRGVREGDVIVLTRTGEHAVNLGAIREMRVNRPVRSKTGSYWAAGLAVGAVLDVVVVVVAAANLRPGSQVGK
jgi:hypothetical protein